VPERSDFAACDVKCRTKSDLLSSNHDIGSDLLYRFLLEVSEAWIIFRFFCRMYRKRQIVRSEALQERRATTSFMNECADARGDGDGVDKIAFRHPIDGAPHKVPMLFETT
jgi:hypothetical protein